MKATISLEGILSILNTFSLSTKNKQWLGEHLLEQARTEQAETEARKEHEKIIKRMDEAFKDAKKASEGQFKGKPLEVLLNEL